MEDDILSLTPADAEGDETVGTQVEISLRGPHAGMDANDSLNALSQLLKILSELERDEASSGQSRSQMTRWTFKTLELGSVRTTLEPLEIARLSNFGIIERITEQLVKGFAVAEQTPEIPPNWTPKVASLAAAAVRKLGASPDVGMRLALPGTNMHVDVTQRAHRNLRDAMKAKCSSYGSRRGRLRGLYDSSGSVIRAILQSDIGNERIPLECPEEMQEDLRDAWRNDRVEVTGQITENSRGQVMKIRVEEIEVLPTEPALSEEDLSAGFWQDMTGGLTALEHLAVIRGEA